MQCDISIPGSRFFWVDTKYIFYNISLYNEERRLGDQRGSDTLVVPFITANDGISIAFIYYL